MLNYCTPQLAPSPAQIQAWWPWEAPSGFGACQEGGQACSPSASRQRSSASSPFVQAMGAWVQVRCPRVPAPPLAADHIEGLCWGEHTAPSGPSLSHAPFFLFARGSHSGIGKRQAGWPLGAHTSGRPLHTNCIRQAERRGLRCDPAWGQAGLQELP